MIFKIQQGIQKCHNIQNVLFQIIKLMSTKKLPVKSKLAATENIFVGAP